MSNNKIKVYFDGLCYVCSGEMLHYSKMKESEKFNFIDITDPNFCCEEHGLDKNLIHKVMHVKNSEGDIKTGIDAFVEIWNNIPQYKWLAKVAKTPVVNTIFKARYSTFAYMRPYLPKNLKAVKLNFKNKNL